MEEQGIALWRCFRRLCRCFGFGFVFKRLIPVPWCCFPKGKKTPAVKPQVPVLFTSSGTSEIFWYKSSISAEELQWFILKCSIEYIVTPSWAFPCPISKWGGTGVWKVREKAHCIHRWMSFPADFPHLQNIASGFKSHILDFNSSEYLTAHC